MEEVGNNECRHFLLFRFDFGFYCLDQRCQFFLAFLFTPAVDASGDAFAVGVSGGVLALPYNLAEAGRRTPEHRNYDLIFFNSNSAI